MIETARPADHRATRAAWWSLAILCLFQVSSMVDRQIISLVVPEIRAELGLSDLQISLIQGLAFALFYAVIGLWMGALVDRWPRRWILLGGIVVWSLSAAGTGLATGYLSLFACRLLVGFGEGAISPAGQSLLPGLFPHRRLTTAMTCFTASGVLGIALSYAAGGYLLALFSRPGLPAICSVLTPWRMVMVITALPGLALCWLVAFIREPMAETRGPTDPATNPPASDWPAFFAFLRQNGTLVAGMLVPLTLCATITQGAMAWTPSFLRINLGASAAQAGTVMSIAVAVGGIGGGLAIALFVDRCFARGMADAALRILAGFLLAVPPLVAAAYLAADMRLVELAVMLIMSSVGAMFGPMFAAFQMITPPGLRGRMAAFILLACSLTGVSAGPLLGSAIARYALGDPRQLGPAIAINMMLFGPVGGWLAWTARRRFLRHFASEERSHGGGDHHEYVDCHRLRSRR